MPEDVRLLIAVPAGDGVHPLLTQRLIGWGKKYPTISFYFVWKVSPVDRARNQIAQFFLNAPRKFTHLLMIDSDTIPPENAIERLLSHKEGMVTALTPIISYNADKSGFECYDNAFIARIRNKQGKVLETHIAARNTGLQEIFRCGTACLLIARPVFEESGIDQPFFRFVPNADGTTHVRSEDIDFCDRVKAAGIKIFADTEVICNHYKHIMLD